MSENGWSYLVSFTVVMSMCVIFIPRLATLGQGLLGLAVPFIGCDVRWLTGLMMVRHFVTGIQAGGDASVPAEVWS